MLSANVAINTSLAFQLIMPTAINLINNSHTKYINYIEHKIYYNYIIL